MALKINKALTTKDGGTIATGCIVHWITQIPEAGHKIEYFPNFYRNQASESPIDSQIIEIPIPKYEYLLQEGDSLDSAFVHAKYKEYLQSLEGIGNVVEIV